MNMSQEMNSNVEKSRIGRRDFIRKTIALAGGVSVVAGASASGFGIGGEGLPQPKTGIVADFVKYKGASGEMKAFEARPNREGKFPAVIVVHENRGLQPHIQEVTKRMAQEGFLALAPDGLSPQGGTPENDDEKARTMITNLNRETTIKDFVAAVEYLKTHPRSTGKVGCTGFSWGGAMTNYVAVNSPDLLAAVPYYGSQPPAPEVTKIKASMLLHYAENDSRINMGIPQYEEALRKANVQFTTFIYPGTSHAFNNDTNPDRYNKEAATLAWKRTVDFFKEKLK